MRFTHNNINYEIDFEYAIGHDMYTNHPRPGVRIITEREVRYTFAYVYERTNNTRKAFISGVATCQPEDRFVKEIGRALALRNACKHIEDQELRTKIFECYFNRKKQ